MSQLDNQGYKDQLKAYLQKEKVVDTESQQDGENDEMETIVDIEKSILPSLANFLEKLDNELLKAYQSIQHSKIEYL